MRASFTILYLFLTLALVAQNQKGNWYLDGATVARYESRLSKHTPDYSSFSVKAYRIGYFFTDRLLIGSGVDFTSYKNRLFFTKGTEIRLRPFARYYFSRNGQRKVSYFGQVGIGTFNFFNGRKGYVSGFSFGVGAEVNLQPGILGTVHLRSIPNAQSYNTTSLLLGVNVLMGQLENTGAAVSLTEGTIMMRARLGSFEYDRISVNGRTDQIINVNLTPWVGVLLSNHLMLEGGLNISFRDSRGYDDDAFNQNVSKSSTAKVGAKIALRYYLKEDGILLPYLMAGSGFVFTSGRFRNNFGEVNGNSQMIPFRIGAGASYFLSPNLALDAELAYDRSSQLNDFQAINTVLYPTMSLELGFRFFLSKK
jgi:opacity protein-like surface antigen